MKEVRSASSLFLHVNIQFFQHCLLIKTVFSLLTFFFFPVKSQLNLLYGSISGLFTLFHWPMCLFFCKCHAASVIVILQKVLRSSIASPMILFFFLNGVLALLGLLLVHVNFLISLSVCKKYHAKILDLHWIYRSSWKELTIILRFPIHEHGISLHFISALIFFFTSEGFLYI
jgi:hypothetical protein